MVTKGKILGHIVFRNDKSTDIDKIAIIVDLARPHNAKGVPSVYGPLWLLL